MRCWFGKCNFLHICSEESGKKTAKDITLGNKFI